MGTRRHSTGVSQQIKSEAMAELFLRRLSPVLSTLFVVCSLLVLLRSSNTFWRALVLARACVSSLSAISSSRWQRLRCSWHPMRTALVLRLVGFAFNVHRDRGALPCPQSCEHHWTNARPRSAWSACCPSPRSSATTPRSLLFSVASSTKLIGHIIFTAFVGRHRIN